jgi:hypothetical protein
VPAPASGILASPNVNQPPALIPLRQATCMKISSQTACGQFSSAKTLCCRNAQYRGTFLPRFAETAEKRSRRGVRNAFSIALD